MDTLAFLAPPFVASLILTGIHAYLGLHVVERGVIFVDLSLAQFAALGSPHSSGRNQWIRRASPPAKPPPRLGHHTSDPDAKPG